MFFCVQTKIPHCSFNSDALPNCLSSFSVEGHTVIQALHLIKLLPAQNFLIITDSQPLLHSIVSYPFKSFTRSLSQARSVFIGSLPGRDKRKRNGGCAAKNASHFLIKHSVSKILFSDFIPHWQKVLGIAWQTQCIAHT